MIFRYLEVFSIIMFFICIFGLITCNNIVKSIIFALMMQTAVIMFWLTIGRGSIPPIIDNTALLDNTSYIADPLPQALMLTAIIIGISVTAVIITMLNTLFRKHLMTDWKAMEKAEDEAFKESLYGDHLKD
ncbi:MAG: cation:proton antiporter subunit C [Defluviitaleaceae bacterium]|nr:cation:proton antiporter subunit C [Defluviitaleaceae bacterium]